LGFLLFVSTNGCLPLDYTPLDQRFHEQTRTEIARFDPEAAPSGPLLAGAARIEITPPVGLPLAAYGARRSTGVHDPVFARALVLSNGKSTVAIVSADLLAIPDDLTQAVETRLRKMDTVLPDHLMITATHTHSGPGALGRRFWETLAAGPFNAGFFEITADRMAQAVSEARRDLKPSKLAFTKFNAQDLIRNRIIPEGLSDSEVQVMVVRDLDESRTAYLINFSAHPTVLRRKNSLVSGDFPGMLTQSLERQPGVVALYTSGAVADQAPQPPDGKGVYERAQRMGEALASRVSEASSSITFRGEVTLTSARFSIPLPPPQLKVAQTRRLPVWIGRLFFDGETTLQIIRIDRHFLIGMPADVGVEIGKAWKEAARSKGMEAMIIGFANDYVGYVMPAKYYDTPAYEAFMSFNGPFMADYLNEIVMALINNAASPPNDPS
jgi:hypothetical protein